MYRLIPIILLCLLVGCKANEEKLIRKTLSDYKSAVLKDNGNEAVKYVDSQTITYYQHLKESAMTLDSIDIERMRLMDRFQMILMKHLLKPEELRKMDGRQIFAILIKNRTISKESFIKATIGKLTIHENFASAQILIDKRPVDVFEMTFSKERGRWKVMVLEMLRTVEPFLKEQIDKKGTDEHVLFDLVANELNGKYLEQNVWHPYK